MSVLGQVLLLRLQSSEKVSNCLFWVQMNHVDADRERQSRDCERIR